MTHDLMELITRPMRDENTALLSQHETAQHIADRVPLDLPDFSDIDTLRAVGIVKEYQAALSEIFGLAALGKFGGHDDLLNAVAKLESAMADVWRDEQ